MLFASDVDRRWNDFPLHPAFVPFALETLRYAAGDRHRDAGLHRRPGARQARTALLVSIDPPTTAFTRSTSTRARARSTAMPAADFAQMVQRSTEMYAQAAERQAQQTESRQSYWQYGLVLMIATLVAESVVGRA